MKIYYSGISERAFKSLSIKLSKTNNENNKFENQIQRCIDWKQNKMLKEKNPNPAFTSLLLQEGHDWNRKTTGDLKNLNAKFTKGITQKVKRKGNICAYTVQAIWLVVKKNKSIKPSDMFYILLQTSWAMIENVSEIENLWIKASFLIMVGF